MSIIDFAIYGKIQKLSEELKPFTPEERKELEECKEKIENYETQVSTYETEIAEKNKEITEKNTQIAEKDAEIETTKQQSDLYESVLTGDVTEFVVPNSWTKIRQGVFNACKNLISITIPNNITSIEATAFSSCSKLKSAVISAGVTSIKGSAFYGCVALTDITIPNTITTISVGVFTNCSKLTNVTLGDGFNCNGLDLSPSTKYSADTLTAMFTALADRTGQEAYTLTLGSTNLAKLSDEQKAIATDKNWTLA